MQPVPRAAKRAYAKSQVTTGLAPDWLKNMSCSDWLERDFY